MNYLSAQNAPIWLSFTTYAVTALFVVSNKLSFKAQTSAKKYKDQTESKLSQFSMRIVLIFPLLILLRNI